MKGKANERDHQIAYFQWVQIKRNTDARYHAVFAVPNEGDAGTQRRGSKRKVEGASRGVPDVLILVPARQYAFAGIELKIRPNTLTKAQYEWLKRIRKYHGFAAVAWSGEELQEITEWYLEEKKGWLEKRFEEGIYTPNQIPGFEGRKPKKWKTNN